jgi:outer membrane biogenesis lipoprotein LolB
MKKVRLLFIWVSTVLLFAAAISAQQVKRSNNSWVGEYEHVYSEGKDFVITYTIAVTQKGDKLSAQFSADGYQSNNQYECSAEATSNEIKLYFVRDLSDVEGPRLNPRKKNELIATLNKKTVGGKPRFLYLAGSYEIVPRAVATRNPVYFKKIK